MLELARPALLGVLPLAAVVLAVAGRGGARGVAVSLTGAPGRSAGVAGPVLRAGVLILLALALAGPVEVRLVPPPPDEGAAVVAVLDVSESMRTGLLDGAPRLEAAVEELRRFLAGRDGDQVGVVAFAGTVTTLSPPVGDPGPALAALDRVADVDLGDGTALGTALGVAANRLRAVDARSRVLVLLSDGEHNAGPIDPVTAARAAALLGVRVYTVAVGGAASVLAPVAEAGGGRAFVVADRAGLDAAYRSIDALEPSAFARAPTPLRVPRHAGLLWMALALLAAEAALRASPRTVIP